MQITRNITLTTRTPTFLSGAGIASTSPFIPTLQKTYIITAITITTNTTQQKGSGTSKKRAVTWMLRREESGCFLLAYRIIKDVVYLVYSKNALLGGLVSLLKSITPPSFAVLLSKFRYRRVWARGEGE